MVTTLQEIIEKDIFTVLGLSHLREQQKTELFNEAYQTILNRILLRVADQLNSDEIDTLKNLFLENDTEKIIEFLSHKNIDIDQLLTEETVAYKIEMVSLANTLRGQQ